MQTSVILLTKNAGDSFGKLLSCLFSQQHNMSSVEVLMIDSGSTDNTLDTAHKFSIRIVQIKPEEFHHGKTRNLGAELAKGDILVYLTQDAMPDSPYWLANLVSEFEDSSIAMVVGRQMPWEHTKPPEKFFYNHYFPNYRIMINKDSAANFMLISNVNSAIRKSVWRELKFSESIVLGEDKEFARRVLAAGYNIVYQPQAAVYHAHDYNLKSLWNRHVLAGAAISQGSGMQRSGRITYYLREIKYLIGKGEYRWIPYSMVYEACKLSGAIYGMLKSKLRSP